MRNSLPAIPMSRPIFPSISSWTERCMTGRATPVSPSTSSGHTRAESVEARLTPRSAADKGFPVLPRQRSHEAGIIRLGLSNFHRAHQAVYTAQALDLEEGPWGIVGIARQSRDVLDAMTDQDLCYAVLSLEGDTANIQIITVTVTEAGYTFNPSTGGLDLDRPELAADLAGRDPFTTVGQLAH